MFGYCCSVEPSHPNRPVTPQAWCTACAPERDSVKLVQNRFVESFTDAVRLWVKRLGFGVLDVVEGQV